MTWLRRLFGADTEQEQVDYYREGCELLRVGHYHEALTSFRLALRETPNDAAVLQQMAIAYTRIGLTDEAAKTYRQVLDLAPDEAGAHYGLGFLLLREGKPNEAAEHLRLFLAAPPVGTEAAAHVQHAREALDRLSDEDAGPADA